MRSIRSFLTAVAALSAFSSFGATTAPPFKPTAAYDWLDVSLEATAREVDRHGARPTIISRTLAIALTAMYDGWAAYDDKAVGSRLGASLRRPPAERTYHDGANQLGDVRRIESSPLASPPPNGSRRAAVPHPPATEPSSRRSRRSAPNPLR